MDSVMRVSAFWRVAKPYEVVMQVWQGEGLNNIEDMEGNKLKDAFLREKLTKEYPFFSRMYKETSGYVHLSKRHIASQFESVDETERKVSISIGRPKLSDWREPDMLEAIDAFIGVTNILIYYCEGWCRTKDNPLGRNRPAGEVSE